MIILIIASSSLHHLLLTEQAACKWTDSSAVVVDIENERFTVMCLRYRQNFKFENFTMSFGRLRLRIVLKCVPHVQHDHFCSSTNQIIVVFAVGRHPCLNSKVFLDQPIKFLTYGAVIAVDIVDARGKLSAGKTAVFSLSDIKRGKQALTRQHHCAGKQ